MLFRYLLVSLASFIVFGCTQERQSSYKAKFSDEQTSFIQVGDLEDISTPQAKRVNIRIKVPIGRTKEELTATLERAAHEIEQKTKANAISVFAYRPQDPTDSAYSAGMAEYAPNGKWADAAKSEPMQVKVELNDLYFAAAPEPIAVNSLIKLKAQTKGEKIGISREYESWGDKDMIAYVPEGTEVRIIKAKSQPIGSSELIRYQVSVNKGNVVGWVHKWNVK